MTSEKNYKGEIIHYSAHKIYSEDDFGFLPEDYSKFKHGAIDIARKFGYDLADNFIKDCFSKTYDGGQLVVVPSAYSHIPTASFFMKVFFMDKLNNYLFENGYPVAQETKIDRSVSYREDYGEMSADDRYKLIKGDHFHIDRHYLQGKTLIFLDDIKITGTHERIIINMLNEHEVANNCYMLYYGELMNDSIPPNIENYLNNYWVGSVDDVDMLIKNENFEFNTRVVKYILNNESAVFDAFISQQTAKFISSLYYNAIGNEYYKFSAYLRNINYLKTIVFNN